MDPIFHVFHNFIHSRYDNHMFGAMKQGGQPVTGTVDIYQLPLQRDGIGPHQKIITAGQHFYSIMEEKLQEKCKKENGG